MQSFCENPPGTTTPCMASYTKPLIRGKPNHVILHVRTDDLNSNAPADEIAKTIINLASELKSEKSDVTTSSFIMRADKPELNKKGRKVNNNHLKEMSKKRIFFLLIPAKRSKQVI